MRSGHARRRLTKASRALLPELPIPEASVRTTTSSDSWAETSAMLPAHTCQITYTHWSAIGQPPRSACGPYCTADAPAPAKRPRAVEIASRHCHCAVDPPLFRQRRAARRIRRILVSLARTGARRSANARIPCRELVMPMIDSYPAHCALSGQLLLHVLNEPSEDLRIECERFTVLGVVDGLVSVTRKAWFSALGSNDDSDNRAAQ